MQISTYKIPKLIIIATIIGSIIVIISAVLSKDTRDFQKSIYTDLIGLVGQISSNKENIDSLKILKREFDRYYNGEMIFAEAKDKELLQRMMVLNTAFENQIQGRKDFYTPEKLDQSCVNLIKQLTISINSGDSKNLLKLFIPLVIGSLLLMFYFFYNYLMQKFKRKKIKEILTQESAQAIKELIGNGRTAEALERFSSILNEKKYAKVDELIMLKSKFIKTQNDRNLDLINSNEERMATSRINKAMIDLLNDLLE